MSKNIDIGDIIETIFELLPAIILLGAMIFIATTDNSQYDMFNRWSNECLGYGGNIKETDYSSYICYVNGKIKSIDGKYQFTY